MKLIPIDTDSFDCRAELLDLYSAVKKFHEPPGESCGVGIRNFLNAIRRSIKYLANKFNCRQSHVYRAALRLGTPHLYNVPGVLDIKKSRVYIFEHSTDLDDIRALENRFFDLKTNDTSRFFNRFPESDVSYCNGLADLLDLNKSIVFQMSLIFPLLHSKLPVIYHNQMAKIFIRFQKDVARWGKRAMKVKNSIEKSKDSQKRIDLEDIYDLLGY